MVKLVNNLVCWGKTCINDESLTVDQTATSCFVLSFLSFLVVVVEFCRMCLLWHCLYGVWCTDSEMRDTSRTQKRRRLFPLRLGCMDDVRPSWLILSHFIGEPKGSNYSCSIHSFTFDGLKPTFIILIPWIIVERLIFSTLL